MDPFTPAGITPSTTAPTAFTESFADSQVAPSEFTEPFTGSGTPPTSFAEPFSVSSTPPGSFAALGGGPGNINTFVELAEPADRALQAAYDAGYIDA